MKTNEEIVQEFITRFGANKIWVVPSRENVETILEIEQFIRTTLEAKDKEHTAQVEEAVKKEMERIAKAVGDNSVVLNEQIYVPSRAILQALTPTTDKQ